MFAAFGAALYTFAALAYFSMERGTDGLSNLVTACLFTVIALLFIRPEWFLTAADDE
jgi:hypothetical protein